MDGYYRDMIESLPEDAEYFVQEYKENILSVEDMRNIYEQQKKEWGSHTLLDIDIKKDENTGLYYAHVGALFSQGLLYDHLIAEQLYAQKEHVDWAQVTDGYDNREIEWWRHILTHPLVWVPTMEVENQCVVVGKVAKEEARPDVMSINDRHIHTFCWEMKKKGLLWFADNMPVLKDVRHFGRREYSNLPEDMLLWDRLMEGPLFKSNPYDMHHNIQFIAAHRGPEKAVEIVERFREDWQDIVTLRLFNLWEAEDFEVQRLHRTMFVEMDRQLRIWKKKVEEEKKKTINPDTQTTQKKPDSSFFAVADGMTYEICEKELKRVINGAKNKAVACREILRAEMAGYFVLSDKTDQEKAEAINPWVAFTDKKYVFTGDDFRKARNS